MSTQAAAAPAPVGLLEELVADLPEPDDGGEENVEQGADDGSGDQQTGNADDNVAAGDEAQAQPADQQDDGSIKPLTDEELDGLDPKVRDAINARLNQARESKRTHDQAYIKLKRRESKLNGRVQDFNREKHAVFAMRDQIQANLNILRNGDGAAVLSAMQQLTGRDPHAMVEAVNMSILGKKRPDAETQELKRELSELREELKRSRETEREERAQAELQRQEQQAIATLTKSAENASAYPRLAAYTKDNRDEVSQALVNIKIQAYNQNGQVPISDHDACQLLEQHLTKLASYNSGQAPAATTPNPVVGRAPNANPGQQPARRSPAQSLTAQQMASGHSQREMTDREVFRELADDPEINRVLGGFLNQ